jgi:hypothetical protein
MGRPSDYTPETADAICEEIADGRSLRSICDADSMPNKATVFRWLAAQPEFRDQYACAREAQADSYVDDITDIADRAKPDDAAVARLRIDARKWAASKLKPKAYSDKVDLNLGGQDGNPVIHRIELVSGEDDDSELDDSEG